MGELQKMFSQPRIQTDVRAVLEMDNLGANSAEVNRILGGGMVMETTIAPGTRLEWMALRRAGRPATSRRVQWAGDKPLEGYQFVIDNLTETLTFFVPKICGNISLMSREPSREAARRAEEARKAEAAKAAAAAAAADAARKAEEARKAAEAQKEAEARKAAEARTGRREAQGDEERAAAEARRAEEARKKAEQDRLASGRRSIRRSDRSSPGTLASSSGSTTKTTLRTSALIRPDNTVPAFGNKLFGVKGGVQVAWSDDTGDWLHVRAAIGVAINLDEGDRTSLFGDLEVGYTFASGVSLGTGLTLWDFTHGDQFTFGWLGTAAFPVWKNETKRHKLDFSVEWRQFFDRMSDPDVNYQFWGGLRYMFK